MVAVYTMEYEASSTNKGAEQYLKRGMDTIKHVETEEYSEYEADVHKNSGIVSFNGVYVIVYKIQSVFVSDFSVCI